MYLRLPAVSMSTTTEVPVPDKKPILNGETKPLEFVISSTNDLSYPCFIFGFQMAANGILLLQFMVLIAIIVENHNSVGKHQTFTIRMGQLFVFIYLLYSSPGGLSITQKVKMRLTHSSHHSDDRASIVMRSESTNAASILDEAFNGFLFSVNVIKALFWSCYALPKYCICEIFCPKDSEYLGYPTNFLSYLLRLSAVALEGYIVILTIIAAILVMNSQSTLIDILFNFTGVMIVSTLDEVIMSAVPKYKIKLLVPNNFENEDPTATKDSVEIGVLMFSGLVMILTMLGSTRYHRN